MTIEDSNLKLFSIFHYVLAGFVSLFSMIPLLYLGMGVMFSLAPALFESKGVEDAPPAILGFIFGGIGLAGTLVVLSLAVMLFLGARNLGRARHLTLCTVVAALSCFFMPFGTILGILTLVELNKREVRALFEPAAAAPPAVQA
ncbi:MAG: hypothetical protein QUS11_05390 [Candidatus Fermentibacter sp.]|nr:hypothetical protein [Candidatus Fermentibacter sp.]